MAGSTDTPSPRPGSDAQTQPRGVRPRVERLSSPILQALGALPVWLPFLVVLGVMLTGAFLGGWLGALLLAVPLAFLCWLLYLTWPRLSPPERAMRVAVLSLVVALVVTQVVTQVLPR